MPEKFQNSPFAAFLRVSRGNRGAAPQQQIRAQTFRVSKLLLRKVAASNCWRAFERRGG